MVLLCNLGLWLLGPGATVGCQCLLCLGLRCLDNDLGTDVGECHGRGDNLCNGPEPEGLRCGERAARCALEEPILHLVKQRILNGRVDGKDKVGHTATVKDPNALLAGHLHKACQGAHSWAAAADSGAELLACRKNLQWVCHQHRHDARYVTDDKACAEGDLLRTPHHLEDPPEAVIDVVKRKLLYRLMRRAGAQAFVEAEQAIHR
mmetsp:Transcript_65614/g.211713  ORF Transcript_65614/g.211713 Transcript_65614/m.211713 type:complete len:206 (+) Transcript_65614:753-1370(+)